MCMVYEALRNMLAYLAASEVYGPLDRLARAADKEAVSIALYEALRYISTEVKKCIEGEKGKRRLSEDDVKLCEVLKELTNMSIPDEEIAAFLRDVDKKGVSIAKRLASEALAYGLRRRVLG